MREDWPAWPAEQSGEIQITWNPREVHVPEIHALDFFANQWRKERLYEIIWIYQYQLIYPIVSMCGMFTYIWLIFMVYVVHVGKYTIHGYYGNYPGSSSRLFFECCFP